MEKDLKWLDRRSDRKRKLLPKLNLEYPNDEELSKLARLAKVDHVALFGQHICSIVLDAHLNEAAFNGVSKPKVKGYLNNIAMQAERLATSLRKIDVGNRGSAHYAGFVLELELSKADRKYSTIFLPEYAAILQTLVTAAKTGAASLPSRRGPKPLTRKSAFDVFVENLYFAARQRRGHWTVYRSADQTYTGTLLQALSILKRYLPRDFIPARELGRKVEYIRDKLKRYIAKNTPSA